jgi:malate dehydrogenase (oxaloacetate-decarboxylating)(NADP+)
MAAFSNRNPLSNRGLATSPKERVANGLQGLLPARVRSFVIQEEAALAELRALPDPLSKYKFLQGLQNTDERLYFALIAKNTAEIMPLIYTPTVGEACVKWSSMLGGSLQPRGLYISLQDLGNVRTIVDNWPRDDVKVIVFTDGERILGLGDLGANGMGIPVGKLALYTACAGIPPQCCLPVVLDVGTNTESIRDDPLYVGLPVARERGAAYDQLVDEFVEAARGRFGEGVLLQFEDFGNSNAFRLLDHYADRCCTFNDDIQGTASVALAGILAACCVGGDGQTTKLADQTFLFAGAGEAGVGIANLLATAIAAEASFSLEEARARIWLVDSRGLVTAERRRQEASMAHHKLDYAHEAPNGGGGGGGSDGALMRAVKLIKPTALIGVSAQAGIFNEAVVREFTALNAAPRPGSPPLLVFALSNPTSKAECTAAQAYEWTE